VCIILGFGCVSHAGTQQSLGLRVYGLGFRFGGMW
jgi:hypothetical protein